MTPRTCWWHLVRRRSRPIWRRFPDGGTLIVNEDSFTAQGLNKAGYDANPLDDDSLSSYRVIRLPINSQNAKALAHLGLSPR